MKKILQITTASLICLASVAAAKDGVSNDAVKARMATMDTIRTSTRTLGSMVQGKAAFDAGKAEAAATAMAAAAATIAPLFEEHATDPKSEAKPEIWSNWADFTSKANALQTGAENLDASSLETLQAGFGGAAGTCRACHSKYRM